MNRPFLIIGVDDSSNIGKIFQHDTWNKAVECAVKMAIAYGEPKENHQYLYDCFDSDGIFPMVGATISICQTEN